MKAFSRIGIGILFLLAGAGAPISAQQDRPAPDGNSQQDQSHGKDKAQQRQDQNRQGGKAKPAQQSGGAQGQLGNGRPGQAQQQQPQRGNPPGATGQQGQRGNPPGATGQRVQPQARPSQRPQQARRPAPERRQIAREDERGVWQQDRAQSWESQHRTWQQRGGYHGYRIPQARYRAYFGRDRWFRLYGAPMVMVGRYPRFQYGGYWFRLVDPWPESWSDNWYEQDDVSIDYYEDGYYLSNRDHPGVLIAVRVYAN